MRSVGQFAGKGAREFWISTLNRTKALGTLCNRLFSTPANSVPSERSFSIQNYIHTKIRNSLKSDRVDKLIYIYMNSRIFDARKEDNKYILTINEKEQLEEEMMEKMIDIEDLRMLSLKSNFSVIIILCQVN